MTRKGVAIHDEQDRPVERAVLKSTATAQMVDKGNHKHFMAKEIHEQPEVVGHTLAHYIDMIGEKVALPGELPFDWTKIKRLSISACGTAYYAGLVAKYWFERFAKLPVEIDIASEFRYRERAARSRRSRRSSFRNRARRPTRWRRLRYAKEHRQHVLSVVNVPTSTIARESDVMMPTLAGPEIGVASTKAFTCQLAVLACLAIAAGRARGELSADDEKKLVRALIEVPRLMAEALGSSRRSRSSRTTSPSARDVLYLGRGTSFPIALEGALKLKEISYIHAEGYAAGELKHGPIALIDETMPVIVLSLIHGPGCPVCVTAVELIDKALEIAARPEVTFCSFGDMLRVPGSSADLLAVKARGGDVRVVYSPMDAVQLAERQPGPRIVFSGSGLRRRRRRRPWRYTRRPIVGCAISRCWCRMCWSRPRWRRCSPRRNVASRRSWRPGMSAPSWVTRNTCPSRCAIECRSS